MESTQPRSTIDILHSHVSVRRFTDEPVADDLLETILEAGTRASTSSNMQSYSFISITDPTRKAHLAQLCADQTQIHQSAAFLAFCADLHRLSLCLKRFDVDDQALGLGEALMLAVIDTALVMQNVAVAAESVGLGVCMIGAMRNHPAQVRDALKLPHHVFAIAGMCIGWPAEKNDPKPRLPLDAVWHREQYRSDGELESLIDAYDALMTAYHESQGRNPIDPRWSSVMSRRVDGVLARKEVDRVLREQGFLTSFLTA
jgi:nitroreductase